MDYEISQPFNGNREKALDHATRMFTDNGFRIVSKTASSLEVQSPGMSSTKQNAILGISRAVVEVSGQTVSLRADFGSARRMIRIVAFAISGLAVFFAVLFPLLATHMKTRHGAPMGPSRIGPLSVLPLAPWPILLPLIAAGHRRRIRRELETLVHNMVMVGSASGR
jgi:hypothetical protein